jgi:NitT/TauT family transport system substrate-binding protein
MKILTAAVSLVAGVALASAASAFAQGELRTIRIGWCAKTITSAASPYAIATKLGWFAKAGIKIDLIPLPGSTDCVKFVATRDLLFSLPSIEPVAIIRTQGVKMKNFYTAYQGNIYGVAVPVDSPIKTLADMKGKRIGVTSMASASVIVTRALLSQQGLDPNRDASIIVAGDSLSTHQAGGCAFALRYAIRARRKCGRET